MIPLILSFLIHNHFLLPKFMKKGKMRQYCLLLLLVLSVYGGMQYVMKDPVRKEFKEKPMPPRPPHDFRDAPAMHPPMHDRPQNMILELSHLMRYVLYESENDMTTLAAEARFVSSYVSLMKKRYVEGIVRVNLDIQQQTSEDIHMPTLLFVSFIENAFKHGVSYSNETTIDIKLNASSGKILFTCDNTIPQTSRTVSTGKKTDIL